MREINLTYPEALRQLWKPRKLYEAWYWEYEGLFYEEDVRHAKSFVPGGYLFGEWFTAIHFYKQGYRVLNEMYFQRPQRQKRAALARVLDREKFALITGNTLYPPDLFVYDPKNNLYFFAEVKLPGDRLSENQKKSFREIEKRMACQVLIVNLKARQE